MLAQEIVEFKNICLTLGFTFTSRNAGLNGSRNSASKLVDIARSLVLNNHPDGYLMRMLAQEIT
ncbi:hypothetical protein ABH944_008704 [Caballeronia udeis]